MKTALCSLFVLWAAAPVFSQKPAASAPQQQPDTLRYQGAWALMEVVDGDTIYNMTLRQVRIAGLRRFESTDERDQYRRYQRAARKVYPYAVQAVELYWEIQRETADMSKRKRKKYVRNESKELKEDFKEQLKQLSKTQGKVLIKMIERQVGKSFYDILSETKGGMTAVYWQNFSKIWGYDLKEGYIEGSDPLLDEVLLDYDFHRKIYEHWKG